MSLKELTENGHFLEAIALVRDEIKIPAELAHITICYLENEFDEDDVEFSTICGHCNMSVAWWLSGKEHNCEEAQAYEKQIQDLP